MHETFILKEIFIASCVMLLFHTDHASHKVTKYYSFYVYNTVYEVHWNDLSIALDEIFFR